MLDWLTKKSKSPAAPRPAATAPAAGISKPSAEPTHQQRVDAQIKQYAKVENMHAALSDILTYWQGKYFKPVFTELTGADNHIEFYANAISQRIERTGNKNVISLGSGDGQIEVQIAKYLEQRWKGDFLLHLVELSPIQNDRAKGHAAKAGVAHRIVTIEADLNFWTPTEQYAAAMAHHSLHHVQDLEHLFAAVRECLHPDGVFATFDVIGRNGHMRWPEAYKLINLMWQFLPPEKRRHAILKRTDDDHYNHDCSTQGFEGIRAQDILPLLIQNFHFEMFYAVGNLTDVFTLRAYGPNFDPNKKEDRGFIDFVEELNEILIDAGYLKPTRLCAIMGLKPVENPRLHKGRTPEMMVRIPD